MILKIMLEKLSDFSLLEKELEKKLRVFKLPLKETIIRK